MLTEANRLGSAALRAPSMVTWMRVRGPPEDAAARRSHGVDLDIGHVHTSSQGLRPYPAIYHMLGSSRSEALFPEGPAQVIPYDGNEMPPTKPTSLQQAASAVFGVTTVVPLLIFVWTLHRIGALAHVESQLGLGLALGVALLGYYIFRRLMGRMASLTRGLGRVVQQGMRPAGDAKASLAAAGKASGLITEYKPPAREQSAEPAPATPMAHAAIAGAATSESRPTAPAAAPILEPVLPPVHRSTPIPGLGMIQEM